MDDLLASFRDPGPAYRGKPFWSWNGELEEAELLRQIHVFKEMGFGGFFMHSRTGLVTEYLGDEWFRLTNACADEAERLGMEAWLYDEDRWPSGTAGGLITQEPKHRAKYLSLTFERPSAFEWAESVVAAFVGEREGLRISKCRRLREGERVDASESATVLVFRIELGEESTFYNNGTYVDTLSRAATDAFLSTTHEAYRQHCGDRLGGTIRGIFTDEPHRGPVMCGFSISNANRLWMTPWTETLFEEYREAFGEELVDRLPELFLQVDGEPVSPVKWRYMELTQRLFLRHFAKPMFDWCTQHNMRLTGHVLHEDSLTAQTCMQGSLMRFYEYMHLPGIDILSEGNRCYWVAKQLSSVARQLGQKWLLSELYGCTGWQMTFEQHKAVGDWQALFGINVRCHHLSWYTMGGEAKRDYPASISFQSAWWRDYHVVEDYFARVATLLTDGEPVCDLLVINPVESVWCQIHGGWAHSLTPQGEAIKELERGYETLFHWLSGAQIDFDYGDEEMLSRLAVVERDANDATVLRVGQAVYRTVLVGRMTTMRTSTLRLLRLFVEKGGRVVFAGPAPAYVDALASPQATELAQQANQTPWDGETIVRACVARDRPRVEVIDANGRRATNVFCQMRRQADGTVTAVLLNVDRDHALLGARIRLIGLDAEARVAEWDCATGERFAVRVEQCGDGLEWSTDLVAGGLQAVVVGPHASDGLMPRAKIVETGREALSGPFAYALAEPNVCVLDRAEYRIGEGGWQPAAEVLKIDRAVRRAFGLRVRAGEMVQPWFARRHHPPASAKGVVRMRFAFNVADIPARDLHLGIEQPVRFQIHLNDRPLPTNVDGWWVDPAIKRIPFPRTQLRAGPNVLELSVNFDEGVNLEAIYLLGDFGVAIDGTRVTLNRLPTHLHAGDVASQGLPFYGGTIRYELPVSSTGEESRLLLELPKMEAACAKVVGETLPPLMIAWQPLRADVTEYVSEGKLVLDVVLTRRNTFGPLHQVPLRTANYGPDNFVTEGERWSDDYMLYPAGLLAPPILITGEVVVEAGAAHLPG